MEIEFPPQRAGHSHHLGRTNCSCQPASAIATSEVSPWAGAIRAREKTCRQWESNQRLDKASWIGQTPEREAKRVSLKSEAKTRIHLPRKITTPPAIIQVCQARWLGIRYGTYAASSDQKVNSRPSFHTSSEPQSQKSLHVERHQTQNWDRWPNQQILEQSRQSHRKTPCLKGHIGLTWSD